MEDGLIPPKWVYFFLTIYAKVFIKKKKHVFFLKKDLSIFFNLDIFKKTINVQFLIYNNKVKNEKNAK